MKITGILFSTIMVQADDTGRKTQTRRTTGLAEINKNPDDWQVEWMGSGAISNRYYVLYKNIKTAGRTAIVSPYGGPGDVLWRREAYCYVMLEHAHDLLEGMKSQFVYKNSVQSDWMEYANEKYGYKWKPAIHMPKVACRRWMRIKELNPQRLQDISEQDAIAEGVDKIDLTGGLSGYRNYTAKGQGKTCIHAADSFRTLIQSIHNKPGKQDVWDANPWVWKIVYEHCDMPENFLTN